jgi:hypothetical protein
MRPEEVTQGRLGELIIVLTEEIVWLVEDEEEASLLLAQLLSDLFTKQSRLTH